MDGGYNRSENTRRLVGASVFLFAVFASLFILFYAPLRYNMTYPSSGWSPIDYAYRYDIGAVEYKNFGIYLIGIYMYLDISAVQAFGIISFLLMFLAILALYLYGRKFGTLSAIATPLLTVSSAYEIFVSGTIFHLAGVILGIPILALVLHKTQKDNRYLILLWLILVLFAYFHKASSFYLVFAALSFSVLTANIAVLGTVLLSLVSTAPMYLIPDSVTVTVLASRAGDWMLFSVVGSALTGAYVVVRRRFSSLLVALRNPLLLTPVSCMVMAVLFVAATREEGARPRLLNDLSMLANMLLGLLATPIVRRSPRPVGINIVALLLVVVVLRFSLLWAWNYVAGFPGA